MSDFPSRFPAGPGWTRMPPEGVPLPNSYRIAAPIGLGARWRCDSGVGAPFEGPDEFSKNEYSARMTGGALEVLAPEGTQLVLTY